MTDPSPVGQEPSACDSADSSEESILGVVLAGGQSSRMGVDKASLVHSNGLTFLQHAIERLRQVTSQVAISGRASDHPRVLSIPDHVSNQGPAVAVWSAVRFARERGFEAVLVTPVDMPWLPASELRRFISASVHRLPVCVTLDDSKLHPLVALYPTSLEEELHCEATSDRRSLRAWLEQRPHQPLHLNRSWLLDVNTPQDLKNACSDDDLLH